MQYLLPEAKAQDSDKICVVIDLDETLVHSSFKVGPAQRLPAPGFLREPHYFTSWGLQRLNHLQRTKHLV